MGYGIGINPGAIFSSTDMLNGKIPAAGTVMQVITSAGTKIWVSCCVAASQNLVQGHLVTIDGSFNATVASASASTATQANRLGVCTHTSITASASQYIWVQIFGQGSVLASASTLPNVILGMSAATDGRVDDTLTTASAYIEGLALSSSMVGTGLANCFINYPKFAEKSRS